MQGTVQGTEQSTKVYNKKTGKFIKENGAAHKKMLRETEERKTIIKIIDLIKDHCGLSDRSVSEALLTMIDVIDEEIIGNYTDKNNAKVIIEATKMMNDYTNKINELNELIERLNCSGSTNDDLRFFRIINKPPTVSSDTYELINEHKKNHASVILLKLLTKKEKSIFLQHDCFGLVIDYLDPESIINLSRINSSTFVYMRKMMYKLLVESYMRIAKSTITKRFNIQPDGAKNDIELFDYAHEKIISRYKNDENFGDYILRNPFAFLYVGLNIDIQNVYGQVISSNDFIFSNMYMPGGGSVRISGMAIVYNKKFIEYKKFKDFSTTAIKRSNLPSVIFHAL
jgi:hypothetical protein